MNIYFLKAWSPDWRYIRELRNKNSKWFGNEHQITPQEHYIFMAINGEDYFIAIDESTRKPVGFCGVVKQEFFDDSYLDIRFCIEEEFQGKGIGTQMIKFLKEKFPTAIGKLKIDNIASQKCFEKNGYIKFRTDDKYHYYMQGELK